MPCSISQQKKQQRTSPTHRAAVNILQIRPDEFYARLPEQLGPAGDLEANIGEAHDAEAGPAQLLRRNDGEDVGVHAHGREGVTDDFLRGVKDELDVLRLGELEGILQVLAGQERPTAGLGVAAGENESGRGDRPA